MSAWSFRRKFYIYTTIFFVSILFVGSVVFLYLLESTRPDCQNNIQDRNEEGIDCGGVCKNRCEFVVTEAKSLWAKSIENTDGTISLASYIKNDNVGLEAEKVPYVFKLFSGAKQVGVYEGEIRILPNSITPLYIPKVNSFESISNVFFEFKDRPQWRKSNYTSNISIDSVVIGKNEVNAMIENNSMEDEYDISSFVFLFNEDNNLKAVSRTYTEVLEGGEKTSIFFSLPQGIKREHSCSKEPNLLVLYEKNSIDYLDRFNKLVAKDWEEKMYVSYEDLNVVLGEIESKKIALPNDEVKKVLIISNKVTVDLNKDITANIKKDINVEFFVYGGPAVSFKESQFKDVFGDLFVFDNRSDVDVLKNKLENNICASDETDLRAEVFTIIQK